MKSENKIMLQMFVELSLEGKKECYKKAMKLFEIKALLDKMLLETLSDKDKELFLAQNEEKTQFNKIMEALIKWHEISEKVEEMEKEMKVGEDSE